MKTDKENKFYAKVDIDTSSVMEKLHEVETTIDRLTEKISHLNSLLENIRSND